MSVAARPLESCVEAQAASSRARVLIEGSESACSTAWRSGRCEMKRRGKRTPAPAQARRAAFSFMSPATGQATMVQPQESARTSVP